MSGLKNKVINNDIETIYNKDINWDKMANKSIFVSGASGMLASYIVYTLIYLNENKNYNIKIIANIRNREKALKRFGNFINKSYFEIYSKDINNKFQYSENIDFIIHAASLASPQYYGVNPVGTILPNVIGTYNLLEYANETQIDSFLFFSSGSIYGDISVESTIKEENIGILDHMKLGNCYGESKKMGETLCNAYFHQFNLPVKSVRIHHTYGPTMDYKNDSRVFSEFVRNIVYGEDIEIKSDGSATRSFCYISDATEAFFKILLEGEDGGVYNMGNSNEYLSIKELAELLIKNYDKKNIKLIFQERKNDKAYTPSDTTKTAPVNTKKLEKLGWNAEVSVSQGFRKTISAIKMDNKMNN